MSNASTDRTFHLSFHLKMLSRFNQYGKMQSCLAVAFAALVLIPVGLYALAFLIFADPEGDGAAETYRMVVMAALFFAVPPVIIAVLSYFQTNTSKRGQYLAVIGIPLIVIAAYGQVIFGYLFGSPQRFTIVIAGLIFAIGLPVLSLLNLSEFENSKQ